MIDQIYIVGKDGNKRKPNTQEKEQAKDIITQMYNKYIEGFIGIFGVFIFLMGFNTYLFINNIFPLWLTLSGYSLLVCGLLSPIKMIKDETEIYDEAIRIIDEEV